MDGTDGRECYLQNSTGSFVPWSQNAQVEHDGHTNNKEAIVKLFHFFHYLMTIF